MCVCVYLDMHPVDFFTRPEILLLCIRRREQLHIMQKLALQLAHLVVVEYLLFYRKRKTHKKL
jgi:hypothetical protein